MMLGQLFLTCLATSTILRHHRASGYSPQMVHITQLEVPESPRSGEDVTLTCRFRLEGDNHRLYTVNWWRDRDQFYTYKANNHDPIHAYVFDGIKVDKESSTAESVVLRNVSEDTSGLFKCEVMGEGPSFRTAVGTKAMNVVVPPQQVEIQTWSEPAHSYRSREMVQLNCTARGSKPRASLTWQLNGRPVRQQDIIQFADSADQLGHVTSTSGLRWRAPDYFEDNRARVSCVASVGGHLFPAYRELHLDPTSSAAFNHQYAGAGVALPNTWTVLALASVIVARGLA